MKKSISLKEFSTTPTVSYMLSKDGHNVATPPTQGRQANPPALQQKEREKPQPAADGDDAMYEME